MYCIQYVLLNTIVSAIYSSWFSNSNLDVSDQDANVQKSRIRENLLLKKYRNLLCNAELIQNRSVSKIKRRIYFLNIKKLLFKCFKKLLFKYFNKLLFKYFTYLTIGYWTLKHLNIPQSKPYLNNTLLKQYTSFIILH